jgi:hypothetical protein
VVHIFRVEAMDVLPDALEQLTARLEALERRVIALEALEQLTSAPAAPIVAAAPVAAERSSIALAGGFFSVLSKALMGIAGAYLLRAVAESGVLPRPLIAAIAIVYALLWLVAAARTPVEAWFASTIYAATSAMILAPMLWELTLNFKVLSAPATAVLLGVFVMAATALAWKQDRTPVYWTAYATATAAALALSVATHDLLPFLATLLWVALIAEIAVGREHQRSVRPLIAAAADLAVWALIFIYASPQNTRMDYPVIGATGLLLPGCLLFLIYAVSIVVRTAKQGRQISVFDTGQAIIAFLLAASSVLFFVPDLGAIMLGALCLLISIASYTAAFLLFGKDAEARNFHIFALWAASLLLAGSYLFLPSVWLPAILSLAAITASVSIFRMAINIQGLAFLLAAAAASGLFNFIFDGLAGSLPAGISWNICLVSACLIACYAMSVPRPIVSRLRPWINQTTAALAVGALLAFLVTGLMRLIMPFLAHEAHPVALIRTIVLCVGALALSWAGSRWHRVELIRIAYAMLGVIAVKILLQDLPLGNLGLIAASIFMFAITLVAVPRLARRDERA